VKGFDDAIDGHHDVADQLSRYLRSRVSSQSGTTRKRLASIDSREAHESYREDVRATFLSRVGGLPDRPETLSTETTGRTERDGYTVENVVFESHPDHHVTGNCYVPDTEGPHPAVLFLCGHLAEPRPDSLNQRACIRLALNGFVVLIIDPLGQGERTQYADFDPDETTVSGGGGVFPHAYIGQKCHYVGTNLLRHMLHDDRCILDYLQARDDVDPQRLGVTGTSGGGLQTLYLALVDDRIDAAAPCCSLSRRTDQMKTGHRSHAEQAIPGGVPDGIDYNDILAALAPLPICVGAATSDRYFPIEGVHDTVEEARELYDLYDAADQLSLVVGQNQHCSVEELDDVVPWLCAQLGDGHEPVPNPEPLDADAVRCTESGSVRKAYPEERTVDELLRESVMARHPEVEKTLTATDGDVERIQNAVTAQLGLDRNGCSLTPRYIDSSEENGLTVDHLWFKTERNPDTIVAGVLVTDLEQTTDAPALVLWENGTSDLPDRSDELARLAEDCGAALLFDPRGVGAVRNRTIPVPDWASHYHGVWGTEFKLANDALLLGESLLGMRVYDCLRAAEVLQSETGATNVSFVGEGTGAYHALYAGVSADDVAEVTVHGLGPSFYEMATEREVPPQSSLVVYDVVGHCDLPHLFAALDQRGVRVEPLDEEERPVDR
jgi:dienelactone hydrolase